MNLVGIPNVVAIKYAVKPQQTNPDYPPPKQASGTLRNHTYLHQTAGRDPPSPVSAKVNPLTGPVAIVDAEPGDALIVTIESIRY